MSLTDLSNVYEKMLQNPNNRKSSSGTIKQPTPYDSGKLIDPNLTGEQTGDSHFLDAEETAYLADIDKRIALRSAGKEANEGKTKDVSRIAKLEKDITELQELMTEMMKTHMKLLEKIK